MPNGTPAYYYYHYDGSGNVTAITDANKAVAALYEYDAFGNLVAKCGDLAASAEQGLGERQPDSPIEGTLRAIGGSRIEKLAEAPEFQELVECLSE